jgi:hypothetical protein
VITNPPDHFGADIVIAWDTEYTRALDRDGCEDPYENQLLCYTFAVLVPSTGFRTSFHLEPHAPDRRGRFTLPSFLARVLDHLEQQEAFTVPDTRKDRLKILLVAHFTRADLGAWRDFPRLKRKFDAVRGTFLTTNAPYTCRLWYHNRKRSCRASIRLVDTMLHMPEGFQSLKALGEAMGYEKIELPVLQPEGVPAIERMDLLKEREPDLFLEYAYMDALIARAAVGRLAAFYAGELGITTPLPPTAAAAGIRALKSFCKESEIDLDAALGYVREGGPGSRSKRLHHPFMHDALTFLADCYMGGRNETFTVGYSDTSSYTDIDLCGAYATVFAGIYEPDWDAAYRTRDIGELSGIGALAFARVRFRFPASVRFPTLAVRSIEDHGLVFPRTGKTYASATEIRGALDLGAKIRVEEGVVIPWKQISRRPFHEFSQAMTELRKKFDKGSLEERLAKLLANSVYGKLGQGLSGFRRVSKPRRVFDSRVGTHEDLQPSAVTSPALAAFITGAARALLGEILNRLPADAVVCSVTTDGWLSNTELEGADTSGQISRWWQELRSDVAGPGSPILEVKHRAQQVFNLKTRGCLTVQPAEGEGIICAKAGVKPDLDSYHGTTDEEENAYMLDLALNRNYETRLKHMQLINLPQQWYYDADLVHSVIERRVNLDYDFKRRLNPIERNGVASADYSEPWDSIEEFERYRASLEEFQRRKKRVLLTVRDFKEFEEYHEKRGQRVTGSQRGSEPPFVRAAMRAWARGLFDLPTGRGSHVRLQRLLAEVGVVVSTQQIKDAGRRGKSPSEGGITELTYEERVIAAKLADGCPGTLRLLSPELRQQIGGPCGPPITAKSTERQQLPQRVEAHESSAVQQVHQTQDRR